MPGPNKRLVTIAPGVQAEAVEVPIIAQNEVWSTYTLEDGSNIRLKHAVVRIYKLLDKFNGDGDPIYMAHSQPIVASDCPPHLKGHPGGLMGGPMGASLA